MSAASRAVSALRDLFRPRCWEHTGVTAWSADEGNEYAEPPTRRPWFSRFTWKHNLYPWFGGDEWCRWTLVVPLIVTSLVVPLWGCRNPDCEACEIDCLVTPSRTDRQPPASLLATDARSTATELLSDGLKRPNSSNGGLSAEDR